VSAWRVAGRDGRISLFSEDALRDAVERGALPSDCLVWREGMAAWAPIEDVFPRPPRQKKAGPLSGFLWFLGVLLATALFLAAGAFSLALMGTDLLDEFPRDWLEVVWFGGAVVLAVATLLFWSAWRGATARWSSMEARGLVRILVALIALAGAGLAVFHGWQTDAISRIVRAADGMRDYRFTYVPQSRTLTIEGQIGPGFAKAVEAQMVAHPVRRIEITSPGGLIQEALTAARRLEARGGVTVVARRFCASACVVVLMGGEQRLADYDMTIDFHAIDSTTDLKLELQSYIQREQIIAARTYLVGRGAPEAYVVEAQRLGAGKIYRVPAVILAERGMLTGLVDGQGAPIAVAEGRARLAEELPGIELKPFPLSVTDPTLKDEAAGP